MIRLFVKANAKWTLRELIHVTASPSRLKAALSGTKGGKEFFQQYQLADAAFGNFVQQLGTALRPLSTVAALWEHSPNTPIKLSEWIKEKESILVFNGQPNLRASLVPVNRLMFNYLSDKLISGKASPTRARFWIFLDEIQDASRLSGLMPLLNLGRSFGIRCVLGFQDLEGLYLNYGLHEGKKLAELARNTSYLKLTSTETAEWASRKLGKTDWIQYARSWGHDRFPNVAEQFHTRDAVSPTDLLDLPDRVIGTHEITIYGFHRLLDVAGILDHAPSYRKYEADPEQDFQPWTSQASLSDWCDEDAKKLGIPTDPTPEIVPPRSQSQSQPRQSGRSLTRGRSEREGLMDEDRESIAGDGHVEGSSPKEPTDPPDPPQESKPPPLRPPPDDLSSSLKNWEVDLPG